MKNFKREGGFRPDGGGRPKFGGGFGGEKKFGGGNRGFGGRPSFGGGNHEPKRMFNAVCAQCGKDCEVPFRPAGDKPVYCRDCFMKQPYVPGRNSNGSDGPRPQDARPAPPQDDAIRDVRHRLGTLEAKMDRLIDLFAAKSKNAEVAAAPSFSAPVSSPAPVPVPAEISLKKKPAAKKAAPAKSSKKSSAKTAKRK